MKPISTDCFFGRWLSLCFCLFLICLITNLPLEASAYAYKSFLSEKHSLSFQHWNKKEKKISGYTEIIYQQEEQGDRRFWVERTQNQNQNKEVFSEKRLWFEDKTGKVLRYSEEDFRTGIKTENIYQGDKIKAQVWTKTEHYKFDLKANSDLIPFEIITYALRAQIQKLLSRNKLDFELYLPVIALELKKKGLPLSLSTLKMRATVQNIKQRQTAYGKKTCAEIKFEPTSFFIKALLPKNRSRFYFTFTTAPPYHLISFEEGDTLSSLKKVEGLPE